ncbi:MAG: sulfotransferase [Henriciella sp.]
MSANTTSGELARTAEARMASGDGAGAIQSLKESLQAHPQNFSGWLTLSRWLFEAGHYREAVEVTGAAERFDPLTADFQSIQSHIRTRNLAAAETVAREMMEKVPHHPRAVFTLAHLARAGGDSEACAGLLEAELVHLPANLTLRNLLMSAREDVGSYAGVLAAARDIVQIQESFQSLMTLATLLLRYGQNRELLAICDRAEALTGGSPARQSDVDLIRGQVLRILGDRDRSVAAFRACLAGNPRNASAVWALGDLKTHEFSAADRQTINAILSDPRSDQQQKCMAAFARAKDSEAQGDWDQIMPLYEAANRLYAGDRFNPAQFSSAISRMTSAITGEKLEVQAEAPSGGGVPIFIVGLPRSGSTLLEQMLASHSAIEGTMEQPVLPAMKRRAHAYCAKHLGRDYLDGLGDIPKAELTRLGEAYIAEGALFRSGDTAFFTDKMPFNFEHIGLIHKILPRAVIVDIRRNPMDCGFSLYRQYFMQGSAFSYDLSHIGQYYDGYLRLMDHWDRVLPGKVFHIQYEDLVAEPERQVRSLLDHIGVPFEAGCLNFHETDRAVRTSSSEQVRQPLYTSGVGQWRVAERHLKPLADSLGPETLSHFKEYL